MKLKIQKILLFTEKHAFKNCLSAKFVMVVLPPNKAAICIHEVSCYLLKRYSKKSTVSWKWVLCGHFQENKIVLRITFIILTYIFFNNIPLCFSHWFLWIKNKEPNLSLRPFDQILVILFISKASPLYAVGYAFQKTPMIKMISDFTIWKNVNIKPTFNTHWRSHNNHI